MGWRWAWSIGWQNSVTFGGTDDSANIHTGSRSISRHISILRIRPIVDKHGPLHRDHVRILDFYLLFPFRVDGIRLMPQHRRYRRLATQYGSTKPYGEQPEDKLVFNRMEPMLISAFATLAQNELLNHADWQRGEIKSTAAYVPEPLAQRVKDINSEQRELIEFLEVLASEYGLLGLNGLKDRTGLLEFRYDAI
jgi:hypothetical protein